MFFVSAFVFFSCEDDLNTIGFKPDENRFKVSFREIELPSSVFISGPVVTSNHGGDGRTPRVLVGNYTDEKFGKVSSVGYIQFRPSSANTTVPASATFESLMLYLSFDYYHYGSQEASNMRFYIHELTDSLITEQAYNSKSNIDYSSVELASAAYGINPATFDESYKRNTDADATNNVRDSLSIRLDPTYGETLFQSAKGNTEDYLSFRKFRKLFKGIAIRSDASNQLVGFNPAYVATGTTRSRIVLNYTYTDAAGAAQKGFLEFSTYQDPSGNGTVSFSKIEADRAGTAFSNINDLYKEFYPDGDNRFIEAGDPVATKFDISNFFAFSDTIPNMLINSAELVIDPNEATNYASPNSLSVRLMSSKGKFFTGSDTLSTAYVGYLESDKDGYLILGEGTPQNPAPKTLLLGQTDNVSNYKGKFTNYFQRLYTIRNDSVTRYSQYALVPGDVGVGKSVSRLIFNKNNLKLRIYYTIPSTKKQE
ncbi:MAG TPA: DUF4270 family protein [Cyclobacteriaceae bacterium]